MCDDQLVNLLQVFQVVFQILGVLVRNSMLKPFFCQIELKLHCIRTCIMTFILFMHHIVFVLYPFCANLQSALGFVFFLFALCFGPYPSTLPRKIRANKIPFTPSVSPSRSQLFKNDHCREAFELNSKRKIWAEHSMVLDEVDSAIRANLESKGWLSLLEIDQPPPTALIREFFSNLSCHVYDSNTLVSS